MLPGYYGYTYKNYVLVKNLEELSFYILNIYVISRSYRCGKISHVSGIIYGRHQDYNCRCISCCHESINECRRDNCNCCDLEHAFYLQTGVDMCSEWVSFALCLSIRASRVGLVWYSHWAVGFVLLPAPLNAHPIPCNRISLCRDPQVLKWCNGTSDNVKLFFNPLLPPTKRR